MKDKNGKQKVDELEEDVCPRCCGAGMVCGHKPEILPGACCVDFGNATCPECRGMGRRNPRKGVEKALAADRGSR
jgi:hypothetical protein